MMVDTVSMFRMRYVVEVPDDCENPKDEYLFPCTPQEYASDTVVCENTREFSQEHIGENIVSCREVTLDEAIDQFKVDNGYYTDWTDDMIVKSAITEIDFDREAYYEEEERKWRQNIN